MRRLLKGNSARPINVPPAGELCHLHIAQGIGADNDG